MALGRILVNSNELYHWIRFENRKSDLFCNCMRFFQSLASVDTNFKIDANSVPKSTRSHHVDVNNASLLQDKRTQFILELFANR